MMTPNVKARELITRCREEGLSDLDLSSCGLTAFPEEIYDLRRLNVLRLRENSIPALPLGIGALTRLEILDLGFNVQIQLPQDFSDLPNLIDLTLEGNKLGALPLCICRLPLLQTLKASDNLLAELPGEIKYLTALRFLDISFNFLGSLPSEIGALSRLEKLIVSVNRLTQLPDEIAQLSRLTDLFIENNKLRDLPDGLTKLSRLKSLRVGRNRQLNLPQELVRQPNNPRHILAWYFQQRRTQPRPLNEAKLIILGHGGVGKTSLVRRLVHDSFSVDLPRTEGIEISKWSIDVAGEPIRLNLWDFGGQAAMHGAHRFFLTEKTVYLIVVEPRQENQVSQISYWLQLISTFAPSSPVILVCNKADIASHQLDWASLEKQHRSLVGIAKSVSCLNGEGISELRRMVAEGVASIDEIREPIPAGMLDVKHELEVKTSNYISYDEYRALCQSKAVFGDDLQDALAEYLHHLGTIHKLKVGDTFILNPHWVTTGIYHIINYHGLVRNRGVFTLADMKDMLPQDGKYPTNKHVFLVEILKECGLCFEYNHHQVLKYLIPDLLPTEEPFVGDWSDALHMRLQYEILPRSILSQFIVVMHSYILSSTYWRFGVVLQSRDSDNRALVKVNQDREFIDIFVGGNAVSRHDFWLVIRERLATINEVYAGLKVYTLISLPGPEPNTERMVDYETVRELRPDLLGQMTRVSDSGHLNETIRSEGLRGWPPATVTFQGPAIFTPKIENLGVVFRQLNLSGQKGFADALKGFSEVLEKDDKLTGQIKAELVDSINDLADQVAKPQEERNQGRIRGALAQVRSALKSAGNFTLEHGETVLKLANEILQIRDKWVR